VTLRFSGGVALSTFVNAILTWRLTAETMRMRKAHTEPNVSIYLQQSRAGLHFLDLVVRNIGSGPAYDVTFEVLEEFDVPKEEKLSQIGFIQAGINYMPPDYRLRTYFLSFLGHYEQIIDKNIKVQISYKNVKKEKISEIILLNMSQYKGIRGLGEDPLDKMAKAIESIKTNINHIATGFKHLRVDTYDSGDRAKIMEAYEKRRTEAAKAKSDKAEEKEETS
jgi:hypothetical protein